jgi:hypothetical protein
LMGKELASFSPVNKHVPGRRRRRRGGGSNIIHARVGTRQGV